MGSGRGRGEKGGKRRQIDRGYREEGGERREGVGKRREGREGEGANRSGRSGDRARIRDGVRM